MYTFNNPLISDLKVNVDLNAEGNIAQEGETAAGQKTFTIKGFTANGNATQAIDVFNRLIEGIVGGSYDTLSATRTITQSIIEQS